MPSLSYSKWDSIDSGSEDEGPGLSPAADFAQQLLSQWIREATNIDAGDSMRLVDFVSLSMPRLNHRDNISRAAEVIEFLDRHSPSSAALLDVLWWCRTKDEDTTDPGERTKVMKLRSALFGALNTLEGAASFGGARQLFDAVQDSEVRHRQCARSPPHNASIARNTSYRHRLASQLRRKYASNVYANARYGLHCRAVLQATMPGPKAVPAWVDTWQRIRMRLTLGVSVLVVVVCVMFGADAVVDEGAIS
jgi:hypothetical protein